MVKRRRIEKWLAIVFMLLCLCSAPYVTAGTVTYTYDKAGRLIKADYGQGKTIEYTYDQAGNLLQRQIGSLNLTVKSAKSNYSPGDTLTLSISINNLSPDDQLVDIFLGIILPDGSAYLFDPSLTSLKPSKLDDPRTFTPARTSLRISKGYQLPLTDFFSAALSRDIPAGTYTAFGTFAEPGSAQSGSPKIIGDISISSFSFSP